MSDVKWYPANPRRMQRRRIKGWRIPKGAVYVGRGSRWGNPFRVVAVHHVSGPWDVWDGDRFCLQTTSLTLARQRAVDLFALHVGPMGDYEYDTDTMASLIRDLAGRDLLCWCPKGEPCHSDVLMDLANGAQR